MSSTGEGGSISGPRLLGKVEPPQPDDLVFARGAVVGPYIAQWAPSDDEDELLVYISNDLLSDLWPVPLLLAVCAAPRGNKILSMFDHKWNSGLCGGLIRFDLSGGSSKIGRPMGRPAQWMGKSRSPKFASRHFDNGRILGAGRLCVVCAMKQIVNLELRIIAGRCICETFSGMAIYNGGWIGQE